VIMYKTLIKPVLMYGAEAWVLSKADEARLWEKNIKENLWTSLWCSNFVCIVRNWRV
jgi:hypothetical protein